MEFDSFPGYSGSIVQLAWGILNRYGVCAPGPVPQALARHFAHPPRNTVLFLLDGLGVSILEKHLPPDSFLRRNQTDILRSVFPPTTAAAATALETGRYPSQSGWLGWSIYWPPIDKNVALYPNTDDQGRPASPVHIGRTYLPVTPLTRQLPGVTACSASEAGAVTLEDAAALAGQLCREPGQHFLYAYLNEPDHTLHREGCDSQAVGEFLTRADAVFAQLKANCPDTLFLLTADHGFTDVQGLCLEDFPALADTLARQPSIEPRAMNLFLKPGRQEDFLRHWQAAMGDSYTLYTHQQVLDKALFGPGPNHPMLEAMVGDYLAVARTPLTLFPNRGYRDAMVATHGGLTPQELSVPLIVWKSH